MSHDDDARESVNEMASQPQKRESITQMASQPQSRLDEYRTWKEQQGDTVAVQLVGNFIIERARTINSMMTVPFVPLDHSFTEAELCVWLQSKGMKDTTKISEGGWTTKDLLALPRLQNRLGPLGLHTLAEQHRFYRLLHAPNMLPTAMWSVLDVASWFELLGETEVAEMIDTEGTLSGANLLAMDDSDLEALGVQDVSMRQNLKRWLARIPPEGTPQHEWSHLDVLAWFAARGYDDITQSLAGDTLVTITDAYLEDVLHISDAVERSRILGEVYNVGSAPPASSWTTMHM